MSKSKSYNRIVFLTTLSVYLGLVLVGGTACNLSPAALTKSFDIKNEIEFKDDFDNNPDKDFPALFAQLLNDIKENAETEKIALPIQTNFSVNGTFSNSSYGDGGAGGGGLGSTISDKNLNLLVQNAINQNFRPKAFGLADQITDSKIIKFDFQANNNDWSLKTSLTKTNAAQFAEFLNHKFSVAAENSKNDLTKQIYENTIVSAENNQVFIVTRLPRGSIDSLLK